MDHTCKFSPRIRNRDVTRGKSLKPWAHLSLSSRTNLWSVPEVSDGGIPIVVQSTVSSSGVGSVKSAMDATRSGSNRCSFLSSLTN